MATGETRSKSFEELLDLMAYSPELLMHPVDLLTVEQASNHAGVPKTTVDSALSGVQEFRSLVVAESINELATDPGPSTWAAMQRGIAAESLETGLAEVLAARAVELATDPAFALFLTGHDQFDDPIVSRAVARTADRLIRCFVPFIETVSVSNGSTERLTPEAAFATLHALLTEAYRVLTRLAGDDADLDRRLAADAGRFMAVELARPSNGLSWDTYFPPVPPADEPLSGRLAQAVGGGAELLLTGSMPLTTRLTVSEITSTMGISVAAFYRRFGSIAEFERMMLERVGRGVIYGFGDEFFDNLLHSIRQGEISSIEAVTTFAENGAMAVRRHIESRRPGHQVVPWFGTELGNEVFSGAYRDAYARRGAFYDELADFAGLSFIGDITGATVSAVLNAHSFIAEMIVRRAPDRAAGLDALETRIPVVHASLYC